MTEKLFLTRIKTHAYDFPSAKEQGIDSAKAIRCVMSSFNLQKHMSQYGTCMAVLDRTVSMYVTCPHYI